MSEETTMVTKALDQLSEHLTSRSKKNDNESIWFWVSQLALYQGILARIILRRLKEERLDEENTTTTLPPQDWRLNE